MFLDKPDQHELRQGDVIEGLYYSTLQSTRLLLLGEIDRARQADNSDGVPLLAVAGAKGMMTAQVRVYTAPFIIVSQCCDLMLRQDNAGQTISPRFLAALLRPVAAMAGRHQIEMLEKLRANTLESFSNAYYIPKYSPLADEYVADFTWLLTIPPDDYRLALDGKILQMADIERVKFKLKLAHFFGRATDEERTAGIYPI